MTFNQQTVKETEEEDKKCASELEETQAPAGERGERWPQRGHG